MTTVTSKKVNMPTGMDRSIQNKKVLKKKWVTLGLGFFLLIIAYISLSQVFLGRTLSIKGSRLNISNVISGIFEDYIPLRARVAPLKTVYLDVVQGGRVEEVLVEDGANVEAGQVILKLSNSDLQLSVMSTESRVMEQLNAMRDQELRLEQNRLNHKRALVDIKYNIRRLEREVDRAKGLLQKSYVSQSQYDNLHDELNFFREKYIVTLESKKSDEQMMASQLEFYKDKTISMEENLAFARKSLEDLNVRAPVSGRLSGFDIEVGQNIPRGERIGQVSDPQAFKLVAYVDEYYLGRVDLGQEASFERNDKHYQMRVAKIYPDVKNGQFEIDLKILEENPKELRRGQTIQSKLTLGDSDEALLIPNGQFYQDTGGKWIFVLNGESTQAYKRNIQLGRRNNRFIEVLEGLNQGEEIITSSYSGFKEMDRLTVSEL